MYGFKTVEQAFLATEDLANKYFWNETILSLHNDFRKLYFTMLKIKKLK